MNLAPARSGIPWTIVAGPAHRPRAMAVAALVMAAAALGSARPAVAQDRADDTGLRVNAVPSDPPVGQWSVSWSPLSVHFSPSDEHKPSVALGLRRALGGPAFAGGAFFTNSFGQPSGYAHYGQRYYGGVPSRPAFYVEWSAGLMYGYVRDRADDVPMNVRGFSPVFLLSPGWQLTPRTSVQLNVAGTAAVMLQFDHRLD